VIAVGLMVAQRLPEPELEPGEARRLADEVFADPVYRQTEPFLDRALRVVSEAFGRILGQLTTGDAGSIVAWLILGAAVLALLWLLRNVFGPLPRLAGPRPVETTIVAEPIDQRDAAAWRAEADRLAAAGAWDEAIRARYRAVVADLIGAGTLDDVAGTTPGEHRRRLLAEGAPGAATFAELTDLFELVWYGPIDAGPEDLEVFRRNEEALLSPVGVAP
jgi:hypothetical protein